MIWASWFYHMLITIFFPISTESNYARLRALMLHAKIKTSPFLQFPQVFCHSDENILAQISLISDSQHLVHWGLRQKVKGQKRSHFFLFFLSCVIFCLPTSDTSISGFQLSELLDLSQKPLHSNPGFQTPDLKQASISPASFSGGSGDYETFWIS